MDVERGKSSRNVSRLPSTVSRLVLGLALLFAVVWVPGASAEATTAASHPNDPAACSHRRRLPRCPAPGSASGPLATFALPRHGAGRGWSHPRDSPSSRPGSITSRPTPTSTRRTGQCPYCETIASEYPSTSAWATATVSRLRSWGFNSLGAFTDDSSFASQMPYSVQLGMASGDDWFAPSFVTNADEVAATQVAPLANDPNLIGFYTDSELHWGPDGSDATTGP